MESGGRQKTVLYADNQLLITKSEDGLQMAAYQINNTAKEYSFKISSSNKIHRNEC
jgi:hypothetical protein